MTMLPKEIKNFLNSAVTDLFKINGITQALEKMDGLTTLEHCDFCAIIGFSGTKIKGHLLLAATHELLDFTHPSKAMGMDIGDSDHADWLGEISNQVIGRLKNALLKYGLNTTLTTPTVIRGQSINSFALKTDSIKEIIHFQLDHFDLLVEAHIELLAPVDFSVAVEGEQASDEGSSKFF